MFPGIQKKVHLLDPNLPVFDMITLERQTARRTREIGIRIAIGAARTDIVWLVMREVILLLAIGVGLAPPISRDMSKYIQSQLYGVQSSDPLSMALPVIAITLVAVLSGYLPAQRAMRVDPMLALRYE